MPTVILEDDKYEVANKYETWDEDRALAEARFSIDKIVNLMSTQYKQMKYDTGIEQTLKDDMEQMVDYTVRRLYPAEKAGRAIIYEKQKKKKR